MRWYAVFILAIISLGSDVGKATDYFVDNAASGGNNGLSWADAWQSFATIQWQTVGPGDTIYISGGESSRIYNERLSIGASGNLDLPVTVSIGQEAGHNGLVVINGGDLTSLYIRDEAHVRLTGQVGTDPTPRIRLSSTGSHGLYIEGAVHHLDVGYLEVTGCGASLGSIRIGADAHPDLGELHHLSVHDNQNERLALWAHGSGGAEPTYGALRIHHCDFFNFHGDPLHLDANGIDVHDNRIHSSLGGTGEHPDGIQISGTHYRIYNNDFYDFLRPDGSNPSNSYIRYNPDIVVAGNVLIYNNVFAETRPVLDDALFRGIEFSAAADWGGGNNTTTVNHSLIANNLFTGMDLFALYIGVDDGITTVELQVVNNIFVDCAKAGSYGVVLAIQHDPVIGLGSVGDGADLMIDQNLIYASSATWYTRSSVNGVAHPAAELTPLLGVQANGIIADPQLDSGYWPQADSPCIDAGLDLAGFFETDKDGWPRPEGVFWDVGPYEYQQSPNHTEVEGGCNCNGLGSGKGTAASFGFALMGLFLRRRK